MLSITLLIVAIPARAWSQHGDGPMKFRFLYVPEDDAATAMLPICEQLWIYIKTAKCKTRLRLVNPEVAIVAKLNLPTIAALPGVLLT